ncbi:hypothetical protein OG21DRAFT_266428 [Imleria badia]|nr:hypothetical protein OG21DRAFT_266428 [Imleria badia]
MTFQKVCLYLCTLLLYVLSDYVCHLLEPGTDERCYKSVSRTRLNRQRNSKRNVPAANFSEWEDPLEFRHCFEFSIIERPQGCASVLSSQSLKAGKVESQPEISDKWTESLGARHLIKGNSDGLCLVTQAQ